jgi:LysM repeat protein
MDQFRVWLTRVIAPLAFLAATTVLVIAVQRALDDGGSSTVIQATEPTGSVPVTIDTGGEEPSAEPRFYRIKAGDTLEDIAGQFDTTVDKLLELNPDIDPLALEPGTRIRVA